MASVPLRRRWRAWCRYKPRIRLEAFQHWTHDKLTALNDFIDVAINLRLDVVVLPNVTVKSTSCSNANPALAIDKPIARLA